MLRMSSRPRPGISLADTEYQSVPMRPVHGSGGSVAHSPWELLKLSECERLTQADTEVRGQLKSHCCLGQKQGSVMGYGYDHGYARRGQRLTRHLWVEGAI